MLNRIEIGEDQVHLSSPALKGKPTSHDDERLHRIVKKEIQGNSSKEPRKVASWDDLRRKLSWSPVKKGAALSGDENFSLRDSIDHLAVLDCIKRNHFPNQDACACFRDDPQISSIFAKYLTKHLGTFWTKEVKKGLIKMNPDSLETDTKKTFLESISHDLVHRLDAPMREVIHSYREKMIHQYNIDIELANLITVKAILFLVVFANYVEETLRTQEYTKFKESIKALNTFVSSLTSISKDSIWNQFFADMGK